MHLDELDLGETQRVSSGALQALASHGLLRLTCLVNSSLPSGLASLTSLQALEVRWFKDADAGAMLYFAMNTCGCRRCQVTQVASCLVRSISLLSKGPYLVVRVLWTCLHKSNSARAY